MQGQYVAGYVNGMDFSACLAAGSWAAAPAPGLVGLVTSRTDITFDNVWIRRIDAPSPAAPTWQVYDGAIAVASGQLSLTMRDGHPLALAVREGFWEDACAIEATLTTDWQGGIAFRVQDKLNYYAVTPFMGWVFLWKVVDGQQVFVTAAWVDLDENEWSVPRQWRVKVAGSNLAVWVYSDGVWEPAAFPANVLAGGPADGGVGLATTGYEALPVLCDSFAVGYDTGTDGGLDETIYSEDFGPGWFSLTFGTESYDAAGNLLKDALYEYTYDAWNRLVQVDRRAADSDDDHKALAVYGYDGLGRRIYKEVANCGARDSTGEYFYYDNQWRLLEVRNAADTPTKQFVWGPRYIDEAISMSVDLDGDGICTDTDGGGAARWYYMQDANWNVVRLWSDTISEGLKSERYEYDPYGTTRVVAGYDTALAAERLYVMPDSLAGNPIRYAGYFFDDERGAYLVRHRMYAPHLERWIQRDALEYADGSGLYLYAQASAVSRTDPYGLAVDPLEETCFEISMSGFRQSWWPEWGATAWQLDWACDEVSNFVKPVRNKNCPKCLGYDATSVWVCKPDATAPIWYFCVKPTKEELEKCPAYADAARTITSLIRKHELGHYGILLKHAKVFRVTSSGSACTQEEAKAKAYVDGHVKAQLERFRRKLAHWEEQLAWDSDEEYERVWKMIENAIAMAERKCGLKN